MSSENIYPATSVILPTLSKGDVVSELSSQIREQDELLVVCDSEEDEVAKSDIFASNENIRLIVAGEPESCSGKANAIYEGMREAENNRVVWTDDDFHHPDNWLETLHEDCDKHGAVSEIPFFIGQNSLGVFTEPIYALVMFVTWFEDQAWGGAVMFDRDTFNEEKFLKELKSTIADDVLLSEHLDGQTVRRTRRVKIDQTFKKSLERITRFMKHVRYHEPIKTIFLTLGFILISMWCLVYPFESFLVSTTGFLGVYAFLGEKRPSFLLGYTSLLLFPFLSLYGLFRKDFVWQGRRYKYNSKLDIEILDR